jgi:hypothetical protein
MKSNMQLRGRFERVPILLFYLFVFTSLWGSHRLSAQMPMPDYVCAGETKHYWVDPTPGSTYAWQVNGVVQSSTTNEIFVSWSNTAGSPFEVAVQERTASGCKGEVKSGWVYVNPLPQPAITGPNNVCVGTLGNAYATQTGMSQYKWTVSAGGTITSGAGTSTITVTWSSAGAQSVTVNYTNANGCKAVDPTAYSVTVNPRPQPTITGPAVACLNTPGNMYLTQPGMMNYQWIISTGGTVTSGGTSTSNFVTITWNVTGNQTVKVNYTSPAGCAALQAASFAVSVKPIPSPSITGPASVCVGTVGNVYTTQSGMTNYQWIVSPGGIITAGGNSTSNFVTVTWNTAGVQSVSVNYANSSGCSAVAPKVFGVSVNPRPIPTISGPSTACVGSTGNVYSTQTGMSGYLWTVSAGGKITSGLGTSSITVTWLTTGTRGVSVNYANASGCYASAPSAKTVKVNPRPAPTITGPSAVCANTTGHIYTTQSGMTGYTWSVSTGGVITSGAGTKSITVTWTSAGAQNVKVNYSNGFGCPALSPTQFDVTVKTNPVPTITGVASICVNTVVSYITEAGMTGYIWSVSPGNTIVSGNGTRLVTVKWNVAGAQTISVIYSSLGNCPVLVPTVKNITVHALPVPTITGPSSVCTNALVNFSTEAGMSNYTWFIGGTGGVIVSGSNSRMITAKWTTPGAKYIQVNYTTPAGCRATMQTTKNVTATVCADSIVMANEEVVPESNTMDFVVYPNPNDGLFTTRIDCDCIERCLVEVYDLLGKRIYSSGELEIQGRTLHSIDLRNVPDGIYSVVFRNNEKTVVKKIIIRR